MISIPCNPTLCTLYGSLAIHWYGLFIALGIIISGWLLYHNKLLRALRIEHHLSDIISISIIAGIIGGRALEIVSYSTQYPYWYDCFALWEGGFSALGSIIGVIVVIPLFLKIKSIPVFPLLDCAALYAPLFQSIARIGCLFAPCCYGIATNCSWGISYTHSSLGSLHNIVVHPTQVYSSLLLFGIFLLLSVIQKYTKKDGQLFSVYIGLASLERFIIDFWRSDRTMVTTLLSFHQIVALTLLFCAACAFSIITFWRPKHTHQQLL